MIQFRAYLKAEPQGSMKAYVRGDRAVLVSDNTKLKAFRHTLSGAAYAEMLKQGECFCSLFSKQVPLVLTVTCAFLKPKSAKKRTQHVVKPDADKLARAIMDALTGVLFHDDAQVVSLSIRKVYADREYVDVTARQVDEATPALPMTAYLE